MEKCKLLRELQLPLYDLWEIAQTTPSRADGVLLAVDYAKYQGQLMTALVTEGCVDFRDKPGFQSSVSQFKSQLNALPGQIVNEIAKGNYKPEEIKKILRSFKE